MINCIHMNGGIIVSALKRKAFRKYLLFKPKEAKASIQCLDHNKTVVMHMLDHLICQCIYRRNVDRWRRVISVFASALQRNNECQEKPIAEFFLVDLLCVQ